MFDVEVVRSRLTRALDPAEEKAAAAQIADLVGLLELRYPHVELDRLNAKQKRLVEAVVAAAVIRWLHNPEGLTAESDGSYSYQRGASFGDVRAFFTGHDLAQLDALLGVDSTGESGFIAITRTGCLPSVRRDDFQWHF